MALTWREVLAKPEFQNLSVDEKEAARAQYFDSVVAPQLPEEEIGAARAQFDAQYGHTYNGPKAGIARTILDQGLQGATFGFADEVADRMGAVIASLATDMTYSEALDMARNNTKERLNRQMQDNPVTAIAANVGGSLMTGFAAAGTKAAKTAASLATTGGRKVAAGTLGGAVSGGFYGAGTADDGEMLPGALSGATVGGAIGGAAYPVMQGVKGAVRAAPAAAKVVKMPVEAADRLIRGRSADQILATRINNPDVVLAGLKSAEPSVLLADIAGDEVQGLMRAVGRVPGGPKKIVSDALTQRSKGAVERVTNILAKDISSVDTYFGSLDDIAKARSTMAAPLYKQAYEQGKNLKMTDSLRSVIMDKRVEDAINIAKSEYGVSAEAARNSLEALDGAKKVLDDMIGNAKVNNKKQLAGSLLNLKAKLVSALDEQVPVYAKARKVFESFSGMEDAQKMGYDFRKKSVEQIVREFRKLNPSEKDAYRVGVRAALQKVVENTASSGDPAKKIIDRTIDQKRLRVLFKSKKRYNDFVGKLKNEIKGAETKFKVLGGSRTDYNIADEGQAGMLFEAFGDSVNSGSGLISSLIPAVVKRAAGRAVDTLDNRYSGITTQSAEDLARLLTDKQASIDALERIIKSRR